MSTDRYELTDPDLVEKMETDDRGRLRLGKDFSDQRVKVAVQRIDDEDSSGDNNQ